MAYAKHPQISDELNGLTKTLCNDDEDIYYNALLDNGKLVSLCGYQHKSPDTGYVKYRYGKVNDIELEYPQDNNPPRGRFLTYNIQLGPNAQGQEFFFYIGDYRYSIASIAHNCMLLVMKGKEIIFRETCQEKSYLTDELIDSSQYINDKELYTKFPQQFQDPSEPEFH
jgi:hypothetical protein